jgi:hypothetical protein
VSRFLPEFMRFKLGVASSTATVIALNDEGAAWLEHSDIHGSRWRSLSWQGSAPMQALEMLGLALGQIPITDCQLVFAPSVLRYWLQTPPQQIASLRELRDVAQARCHQLFGVSHSTGAVIAGWSVSAKWHASQPFVCTAISAAWTQALEAHKSSLSTNHDLVGLVLQNCHAIIPRTGWLAVVVAQSLYLLQLKTRSVLSLRSMRLPLLADAMQSLHTAKEEWVREKLRSCSDAPTLSCLYLHPDVAPSAIPTGLTLLSAQMNARIPVPHTAYTSSEVASTDLTLYELRQEALLTAWCARQHLIGGSR